MALRVNRDFADGLSQTHNNETESLNLTIMEQKVYPLQKNLI